MKLAGWPCTRVPPHVPHLTLTFSSLSVGPWSIALCLNGPPKYKKTYLMWALVTIVGVPVITSKHNQELVTFMICEHNFLSSSCTDPPRDLCWSSDLTWGRCVLSILHPPWSSRVGLCLARCQVKHFLVSTCAFWHLFEIFQLSSTQPTFSWLNLAG